MQEANYQRLALRERKQAQKDVMNQCMPSLPPGPPPTLNLSPKVTARAGD